MLAATCGLAAPQVVSIPSQDGKLQLPGYWFEAKAGGPRPAVVSLHGCNGLHDSKGRLVPIHARDAVYFNREGMHLLALDSFTPRGRGSICQLPVGYRGVFPDDRRKDVYAALLWLAAQPNVDASRIALVGRSHGGSTVLSAMDRTASFVEAQRVRPRAAVALYPGCAGYVRVWSYEIAAPLLLMIGAADDWTPAPPCVELRDKVVRAQKDAAFELEVYADSHHGFDGLAQVRVLENLQTRSGKATVGGNPEARALAYRRMFDFLSVQMDVPLRLTHEQRFRR
jgi:dienelactone hydrolase